MNYQVLTPGPPSTQATSHMIRMRDGALLAADVYLGNEQAPSVLIRLPYDKNGSYCFIEQIAQFFLSAGYQVVAQDVRGKFRSQGETQLFVNEALDGYDTIAWISEQPWSDGSVVMWGESYFGFTQWAAASTAHPALKAISPRLTGTSLIEPQRDTPEILERPVENSETYVYPITHFNKNETFLWEPSWSTRPYVSEFDAIQKELGFRSDSFDQRYPGPSFLRRFPHGHPFDAPSIPCLLTIGWWDNIAPESWRDWRTLNAGFPQWQPNLYLNIDAIDHENFRFGSTNSSEDRSDDEIADLLPAMLQPTIDFFDIFVKNQGDVGAFPRVRWNLAGTDSWQESESWPPSGTTSQELHLQARGTLGTEADPFESELEWQHDPDDPVPSSVPNPFAYLIAMPDESTRADRNDVLTFRSTVFNRGIDLVGSVSVKLTVESTARSMDVFAWLLDVSPDGSARRIARGNLHLNSIDGPRSVVIDMFEVGYRLDVEHSLQLQIASSDFPEFLLHPGHEGDPLAATKVNTNTQRLTVGGPSGSVLSFSTLEISE